MQDAENKKLYKGIDLESLPTRTVREKGLLYDQEVELYDYGLGDDAGGNPLKPTLLHPRAKSAKEIPSPQLKAKRTASFNVAKKFSMLDIAYGFGLNFNKHEGGK